jgi:DNA modification methylase
MKIEKVKIAELNPAEYNPRRMTNKQYEDLKNSLEKFGLVDPIIINADNTVVGGHQRLRIMRELGAELVPVVRVNLSKEDEKELNIRLNKNTGEFDLDVLANNFEIDELKDWGFKDIELGFNIDKIVEGNIEDDHIPEVKESRVKLGDVWELGKHRLMCGDSTKESDVEKLMNGEKADLLLTDPPYGISYSSNMRTKTEKFKELKNDNIFLNQWIPLINKYSNGFVYIWTSWKVLDTWLDMCKEIGDLSNMIIWFKGGGGIGDLKKTFSSDYEIALVYNRGNEITGKRLGSVWEIGKDNNSSYKHPTQKPVELSETAIKNTSIKNNIILDLFLGSGSTLIACEKTNRICYGMELDTKYCDVIIERWEQFTGQKANKCGV